MCGIVGAIAQRDVSAILLEGLRRLEYRGYDSAGIAILDTHSSTPTLHRHRAVGKVAMLAEAIEAEPLSGGLGIAHTRWATHGAPTKANAHPHVARDHVAVVHNGIIENHESIRDRLIERGYDFSSQTDTEAIVNAIHERLAVGGTLLLDAVREVVTELHGAYALGVVSQSEPDRMIAARLGSPLVIGVGIGEHFIASDVAALLPVTRQFIYLEEGDIAEICREKVTIYAENGEKVHREVKITELSADAADRGEFRHFMEKEIHEQPRAVAETLEARVGAHRVLPEALGPEATKSLHRQSGFKSSLAVRVSMPAWSPAIGLRVWLGCLVMLKSPVNFDIALMLLLKARYLLRCRSPAKRPIPWRPFERLNVLGFWLLWLFATCLRVRWSVSPTSP